MISNANSPYQWPESKGTLKPASLLRYARWLWPRIEQEKDKRGKDLPPDKAGFGKPKLPPFEPRKSDGTLLVKRDLLPFIELVRGRCKPHSDIIPYMPPRSRGLAKVEHLKHFHGYITRILARKNKAPTPNV
jgi:hypothetical protein